MAGQAGSGVSSSSGGGAGTGGAVTTSTAGSAGMGGMGAAGGSGGNPSGGSAGWAGSTSAACPASVSLKPGDNNKACEAADVIAAVAPVDFDCVDGNACSQCKPSRPITEIQFRGTSDSLVDYEGSGAFLGAKQNFALWGKLNMCTGEAAALPANGACEQYPSCASGTDTVLCTVQNGMHCGNYSSFMIPQVAWGVLKTKTLP